MSDTIKVTLAYPYTDPDGKTHAADKTISVPRNVGNDLLYAGLAREPDPKSPASTASGNPAIPATAQKEE